VHVESPGLATDLALLEMRGSTIRDRGDHLVIHTPANPTFCWGNFLLLEHPVAAGEIPTWLDRFAAELPEARHRAFGFTNGEGDREAWQAQGFTVETDVTLTIGKVPTWAPVDEAVEIRQFAGGIDWRRSAELGASDVPIDELEDRLVFEQRQAVAQRALVDDDRAVWFGAFIGEHLVGKAGIVRIGTRARFQDVITHAGYRRRGIASGLVRAAGEWALTHPDVRELVIVAEADGPAIGLYERLGFEQQARHVGVQRAPTAAR
jgi:GNAT superfamily N-acetyltransferase